MKSNLSIFLFVVGAFDVVAKKSLPDLTCNVMKFSPCFSSKSSTDVVIMCLLFQVSFVYGLR